MTGQFSSCAMKGGQCPLFPQLARMCVPACGLQLKITESSQELVLRRLAALLHDFMTPLSKQPCQASTQEEA